MSLKERTDRDRSTLVEKNQHQRVTGDDGVTSRLRAANSMTASTCSRSRPSNHSIISSMLAPALRFSKMTETGMRVPLSTHAPLTFPGMLSTAGHCDQSSAAMKGFSFRSFYTKSPFVRSGTENRSAEGYLLGSYRIATAPEPNSSRLTSLKSTRFDSPANNVGPWPANLGCTTNSYSSINPSSTNASGSFTPPTNSPLPGSRLSC